MDINLYERSEGYLLPVSYMNFASLFCYTFIRILVIKSCYTKDWSSVWIIGNNLLKSWVSHHYRTSLSSNRGVYRHHDTPGSPPRVVTWHWNGPYQESLQGREKHRFWGKVFL